MADLSLDEYMHKSTQKLPVNTIKKRLGPKISPKFNVVGVGNMTFDARQKLSRKKQITDARQKLSNKPDVRARIQGPKLRRPAPRITAPSAGDNADARTKIRTAAKPLDARQLLQSRQNKPVITAQVQRPFQRPFQRPDVGLAPPHVTVTGLGRVIGSSSQPVSGILSQGNNSSNGGPVLTRAGLIQKTLSFSNDDIVLSQPVIKTIENPTFQPMPSSRVGNNIVMSPEIISQRYHPPPQPPEMESSYAQIQIPASHQSYQHTKDKLADMPLIRIQNESYRQPEPIAAAPPPLAPGYYLDTHMVPAHMTHMVAPSPVASPTHMVASTHHVHAAPPPEVHLADKVPPSPPSMQSRLGDDPQMIQSTEKTEDYSPLQGCRVIITNLHKVVTQDDIVELFGAVGALKKVRILRLGTAEVVFVKRDAAMAAIRKYNNRELDGQPMQVALGSTGTLHASSATTPLSEISRIQQKSNASGAVGEAGEVNVDISLLHKALFKTTSRDELPSRPVTFTVKM